MSPPLEMDTKINLARASVLLIESTTHAVDLLGQIVKGLGVREVFRCVTIEEAEKVIAGRQVDLVVIEPNLREDDGFKFIDRLRHSKEEPNCYVPIIMTSGPAYASAVGRTRDIGANFFVAKPITPHVLLERILWIARDKRPFVVCEAYIGPERRFKFEGPPPRRPFSFRLYFFLMFLS